MIGYEIKNNQLFRIAKGVEVNLSNDSIDLWEIQPMESGVRRFQSQLLRGSDSADFIIENGKLKSWKNGEFGFGFYETNISYKIRQDES